MKKIVAIHCNPRSTWNTATLVGEAAKGAEAQGAGQPGNVRLQGWFGSCAGSNSQCRWKDGCK